MVRMRLDACVKDPADVDWTEQPDVVVEQAAKRGIKAAQRELAARSSRRPT